MVWKIEWYPKAFKALKTLPFHIQERIIKKVRELIDNPFRFLGHFSGRLYKLRIGDYRALVDVDFGNKVITIQILGHRGRIYKRI